MAKTKRAPVQKMKTERAKIESLLPDPSNVRRHDQRNIDTIKASLAKFGQQKPIVVGHDGVVIAGNGTMQAAQELGWESIEIVRSDLAGVELDDDFDHLAAGFTDEEIDEIVSGLVPDEIIQDEVPEPPADPVTKPGDLWVLGGHRLLCGDCRDAPDVERLMDGRAINVALTSPPYASQLKYDESSGFKPIHPDEYVDWFDKVQANVAAHLADDGSWFVNIKEHCDDGQRSLYVKDLTMAHARGWGWLFVDEFIWTHGGTPKAVKQRFKNGWEPIFQFARGRHKFEPNSVLQESDSKELGFKRNGQVEKSGHPSDEKKQGFKFRPSSVMHESTNVPSGDGRNTANYQGRGGIFDSGAVVAAGMAYPSNVLSLGKNKEALGHSAAFPVSLPSFFIKAFSDSSDMVYDPFIGSGTTLIAAEQLNRVCFGLELSPAYCDIIVQRWENLTGKKAVMDG